MRYLGSDARLVCEPRSDSKCDLDLGDGQVFVYSEYRFRVVCIYQSSEPIMSIKLDVFCSESGGWIKEALVLDGYLKVVYHNVVSCNGELFWTHIHSQHRPLIAVFNPFHLDIPPTSIDAGVLFKKPCSISVSQGALHITTLQVETKLDCSRYVLSVWRLEEDRKSWKRLSEVLFNTSRCNYDLKDLVTINLHPENPEIVFLEYRTRSVQGFCTLSCNMRRGELELFAEQGKVVLNLMVLQPAVSCWPTPIPRYEELEGSYDGSYNCLVRSIEATTSSGIW
ncbi:unnamed protein product [Linum trigynum]|uniref:F-box protein At3g26010-like beta-propeller domain-containing protein n=1 Tax=Linum trigynum TaxID=586398 RepID=A0AAV2EYP4_9ROSI